MIIFSPAKVLIAPDRVGEEAAMPPKKKPKKKAAKPSASKKAANNGGKPNLRPKKGTDFKQLNDGKTAAKQVKTNKNTPAKGDRESEDRISLRAHSSDDDLDQDTSNGDSSKNMSNSATPDSEISDGSAMNDDHDRDVRGKDPGNKSGKEISEQVAKMVGECMKKYKKKSRRRKHKRRKRKEESSDSSSDSSDTEQSTSESDYSTGSDSSGGRNRVRKRKRSSKKKKKSSRHRKGEHVTNLIVDNTHQEMQSPSQSTVYTRGCKSPDKTVPQVREETSETDSQRSGHINSDLNSDEFLSSLETSLNCSNPASGKRRSRDDSGDRRRPSTSDAEAEARKEREREEKDEMERRDAVARDRADEVIRDIQNNKADLAKPTGELNRQLETLLIDMKRFHLTSHVDKKLKDRILEGNFTVELKRLVPQSRSRSKTDQRLNMIYKDGMPAFIPADREAFKDITGYKQWEVAFKVFMGVFISKWPDRANELLEYSHVIHTASLTYPWESVFNYDIAMREILTDNPNRLWGTICQHTWALEIGEPGNKVNAQVIPGGSKVLGKTGSKICWRFNKGRCTFGDNCEFDHRCSVCGGRNHGRHNCYRRAKGERAREHRDVKKEK